MVVNAPLETNTPPEHQPFDGTRRVVVGDTNKLLGSIQNHKTAIISYAVKANTIQR